MNFSAGCLRSSTGNSKAQNDALVKEEAQTSPIQAFSLGFVETSPIVSTSSMKVGTKRKKRQNWSKFEDDLLVELVGGCMQHEIRWPPIAAHLNTSFNAARTGKQCRERWMNHLRPDIKKGNWTSDEEFMIEYLYKTFGPKWSTMSKLMKNRTDNDIKNKWNSMKRTEKATRKRSKTTTYGTIRDVDRIVEEQRTTQVGPTGSKAIREMYHYKDQASIETNLFTTRESLDSETLIKPTVTNGGSVENSPVPTKMYFEVEV